MINYSQKDNQKLYKVWCGIKQRCFNPHSNRYKNYGGRGISICDEWKNSFETFCKWALENGYKEGLSIDRIDHEKNYEPSNCRWTDEITQQNNRTNNTLYEYEGETHTLTEWSRIKGIKPKTFCTRWRRGYRGQDLMKPTMTKSEVGRKYGGIRY